MNEWYVEEGKTGELEIEQRDGSWRVSNPPGEEEIRCISEDDELIDQAESKQRIEATVSSFRRGLDGNTSYLFLKSPNTGGEPASEPQEQQSEQRSSKPDKQTTTNPTWDLNECRGSGKYVNVEATVDSVFYVKKEERGIPDIVPQRSS